MTNLNNEVVENKEVLGLETPVVTETSEVVAETPVVKPKAKKWFEEENAFPYQEGDTVQIVGGKDLLLRLALVVKPSAKKNAVKAQLIHPITGEPQRTQCSFDFERLLLIKSNGEEINTPLTTLETDEKTAV